MFISAGASVSGVYWNRRRTPSTTRSSPVWVISTVGAMSPEVPEQRDRLAEPAVDVAERVHGQEPAVHVGRSPQHRRAGDDVLGDGGLEEPHRGDDLDVPARHGFVGRHAADAAEVVDVTVGVDHRDDGPGRTWAWSRSSANAAVSEVVSGSMTIQPVSPAMKVTLERSAPRTW